MKQSMGMRPQDIVVLCKIIALGATPWRAIDLSRTLHISASEISESLNRSKAARLIDSDKHKVQSASLLEFLTYGIRYVYPVTPGSLQRGIPTAFSASPLSSAIMSQEAIVWECEEGELRGQAIDPLYPTVPQAAREDSSLHEILAVVDALRIGRVREVQLAREILSQRFEAYALQQH